MKKTILTLIIGMLIGAIITAGVFLIINNVNKSSSDSSTQGRFERGNFDTNNMPSDFDANNIPDGSNRGKANSNGNSSNATSDSATLNEETAESNT